MTITVSVGMSIIHLAHIIPLYTVLDWYIAHRHANYWLLLRTYYAIIRTHEMLVFGGRTIKVPMETFLCQNVFFHSFLVSIAGRQSWSMWTTSLTDIWMRRWALIGRRSFQTHGSTAVSTSSLPLDTGRKGQRSKVNYNIYISVWFT